MVRHGTLRFGLQLSHEDWTDIKQAWLELIDYDPYEPDWRVKW